jgi:N-acetylmuramic acid 6-phosphate (MurNAc-6-P) etherase
VTNGKKRVLYVGITCGLSAAYVAGQLDFCLQNRNIFTPVLLGFNPIDRARDSPAENWDKSFLQVAQKMSLVEKEGRAFILNPLIGAEPITGSTRMKCGSATKILLESMFSCAFLRQLWNTDCSVRTLMECYQLIETTAFEQVDSLANLVSISGQCLNANGHIYYLSGDDLGILGLIDASECPPTFGSDVNDVRGFLVGGFTNLGIKQGNVSHVLDISMDYFEANVLPSLTKNDLIILTSGKDDFQYFDGISKSILESKANKALLHFTNSPSEHRLSESTRCHMTFIHSLVLPQLHRKLVGPDEAINFCFQLFKEMACKWTYNVISTGAHILKGKVYQNFMIDVKVRNNKLFHRAVSLVQKFGSCSKEEAFIALVKSIYSIDHLSESQLEIPISEHIRKATNAQKIVSTAIIIARRQCRVEEAKELLSAHSVVRTAMASCI